MAKKKDQIRGAQILSDDLYFSYHEETKDEAQQRIWTFWEAIKNKYGYRQKPFSGQPIASTMRSAAFSQASNHCKYYINFIRPSDLQAQKPNIAIDKPQVNDYFPLHTVSP